MLDAFGDDQLDDHAIMDTSDRAIAVAVSGEFESPIALDGAAGLDSVFAGFEFDGAHAGDFAVTEDDFSGDWVGWESVGAAGREENDRDKESTCPVKPGHRRHRSDLMEEA